MIELRSVSKVLSTAAGAQRHALREVTLSVHRGELLAISGPSGSGKSTLLSLLGCIDVPTSGRVVFEGTDTRSLKAAQLARFRLQHVGVIFRQRHVVPELTVRDNVELPLIYAGVTRHRHERSKDALETVGLLEMQDQMARSIDVADALVVALARAIVSEPVLIIADEPTSAVDHAGAIRFLSLLRQVGRERALVLATDDEAVAGIAERSVRLRDGLLLDAPHPASALQHDLHALQLRADEGGR